MDNHCKDAWRQDVKSILLVDETHVHGSKAHCSNVTTVRRITVMQQSDCLHSTLRASSICSVVEKAINNRYRGSSWLRRWYTPWSTQPNEVQRRRTSSVGDQRQDRQRSTDKLKSSLMMHLHTPGSFVRRAVRLKLVRRAVRLKTAEFGQIRKERPCWCRCQLILSRCAHSLSPSQIISWEVRFEALGVDRWLQLDTSDNTGTSLA